MTGTIDKYIQGKYFFITGQDGNRYFMPLIEVEKPLRKYVWRGNSCEFDPAGEERIANFSPRKNRNPKQKLFSLEPIPDEMELKEGEVGFHLTGEIVKILYSYCPQKACFFIRVNGIEEDFFARVTEVVRYNQWYKKIKCGMGVTFIPGESEEGKNRHAKSILILS